MRLILLPLFILCLLTNTALALAPINAATIQEAHKHGKRHSRMELSDFLAPWVSYEEKAAALNEQAERAYLYTPFVLLALDAREKTLQGKSPSNREAENILTEYTGYVVFSVILYGDNPDFFKGTEAILIQGVKKFQLYYAALPDEALRTTWAKPRPLYSAQCYFYFLDQGIDRKKPMILNLTNKIQQRRFYFDLEKIK